MCFVTEYQVIAKWEKWEPAAHNDIEWCLRDMSEVAVMQLVQVMQVAQQQGAKAVNDMQEYQKSLKWAP
jgi:hypothetical protein